MKIHLRFGMPKDIPAIHEAERLIDGLVIPAHILAHQSASTAAFVCSLPKHDYVVDPMTWILQSPRERHLRKDNTLRPSVGKWCAMMHPSLEALIMSGDSRATLAVADLPPIKECCSRLVDFQLESVSIGHVDPRAKKYLERYSTVRPTLPRAVLPPYFIFSAVNDSWYVASLEAARAMKAVAVEKSVQVEVAPVIACGIGVLDAESSLSIANDYSEFSRCFLWIDGFNQAAASAENIRRVRGLVAALSTKGVAVESLYGGFLMMLMQSDGMEAVSHGILYTQDKTGEQVPGGGMVPERYYIPEFHDFRSLSQANLILKQHPELATGTSTADSILRGDPDRIFMFVNNPELLRKHFLEARQQECELLKICSLPEIVAGLRRTHERYDPSVRKLPNPDAVVSGGEQKGLNYLLVWASAFTDAN